VNPFKSLCVQLLVGVLIYSTIGDLDSWGNKREQNYLADTQRILNFSFKKHNFCYSLHFKCKETISSYGMQNFN